MTISEPTTWLGRAEGPRLEFKREDATLDALLRTIVAFLNAAGGTLVVGVDARGPEDLAIRETGVREPHKLREQIRNIVVDRIDPRPFGGLAEGTIERRESGADLVVVTVQEGGQKPYAARMKDGLQFLVREGASNRVLSVAEALRLAEPAVARRDLTLDEANNRFPEAVACARSCLGNRTSSFYVGVVLETPSAIRDQDWPTVRGRILAQLEQERPLGMRPEGFSLALWPYWRPEGRGDVLSLGQASPLFRYAVVSRGNGVATVWGAMRVESNENASWASTVLPQARAEQGREALMVRALVLVEFASSVARLAQLVATELKADGHAYGRMGLFHDLPCTVVGSGEIQAFHTANFEQLFLHEPADTGLVAGRAADVREKGDASDLVHDALTRLFDQFGKADSWREWFRGGGFVFP